jgi:hypothetical protein
MTTPGNQVFNYHHCLVDIGKIIQATYNITLCIEKVKQTMDDRQHDVTEAQLVTLL